METSPQTLRNSKPKEVPEDELASQEEGDSVKSDPKSTVGRVDFSWKSHVCEPCVAFTAHNALRTCSA